MCHPHDVANHGTLGRAHHSQPARQEGQGTLALGIEETLGCQLLLELFEGQRQGTGAGRLDRMYRELETAARFVDGQAAAAAHLLPILQAEAQSTGVACIHHAVELRLRVLQGEVEMSVGRTLETGHFAFDPQIREAGFQGDAGGAHQFGYREDARVLGFLDRRAVRRRFAVRRGKRTCRRVVGTGAANRRSRIVDMGTLKGFPYPPAMVRRRQSRRAPHATSSF